MSEATAKAVRRDLRRAMGASGVHAVDEAQSNIARLANSLTNAHQRINTASMTLAHRCDQLEDRTVDLRSELRAFQSRSFWQRWRWMVLGQ